MATLDYTRGAKSSSQVMDRLHDAIQAIRLYTSKKLNRKNWSAFEFKFVPCLIGYDLRDVLASDAAGRMKNNKIYLILIATLEASQFVLVNKTLTLVKAWSPLKSFCQKKRGHPKLQLTQKFKHAKMVDGEDLYQHLTMLSNLADQLEEVTMSNVMDEDFMTMYQGQRLMEVKI